MKFLEAQAAAFLLLAALFSYSLPAVSSSALTLSLDSDTSVYAIGEVVSINISGPPSQYTLSVSGPAGEAYRNDSITIGPSGSITVEVPTQGFALGGYTATASGSAGAGLAEFRLIEPFVGVEVHAVRPDGGALARNASVYYYFNGSQLALMVNVSAPNDHISASIDLSRIGLGDLVLSPDSGLAAKGIRQDGMGWYAFFVNETVPPSFVAAAMEELFVNATAGGGASGSARFVAVMNYEPGRFDSRMQGMTTDWRAIDDFTNATGLVFEIFNGSSPLARVEFTDPVDLCEEETARSLFAIYEHVDAGKGSFGMDASALRALNVSAWVWMFGLDCPNQPGIIYDSRPAVMSGQVSGGPVKNLTWIPGEGKLAIEVTALGHYAADGTPPYLASSLPADGAHVGTQYPTFAIFVGDDSGADPAAIIMRLDGKILDHEAAQTGEGWLSVNATAGPLEDGWHDLTLSAADLVGNVGVMSIRVAVDTTPPEITATTPTQGAFTNNTRQEIKVNFTDALSGVALSRVYIDSYNVSTGTGNYIECSPPFNLTEGGHNVTVEVFDAVGNRNALSWAFTVDLTPPRIAYFHPEDRMIVPYNDSVYAGYEDNFGVDAKTISLAIDGAEVAIHSNISDNTILFYPSPPLSKGVHEARLVVTDLAGNSASREWTFRVDDIPPSVIQTSPIGGSVVTTKSLTISATLFDNLEVNPDSVRVLVDGIDRTREATVTKSSMSLQLSLDYGTHTVEVVLSDTSENTNRVSWSFTIREPEGIPPEMIRDIMIMAILIIAIVAVLLALFLMGNRRKRRY